MFAALTNNKYPSTNFDASKSAKGIWRYLILLIFLLPMLFTLSAQTYKVNKYGLKIMDNIEHYRQKASLDPDLALVQLEKAIPQLKTDFVYATKNNFTHQVLYFQPSAYLRRPAAAALKKVATEMQMLGYGLLIYDAYRPYLVTEKMWEVVPDNRYAANPKHGSGHNRGLSVDLSLYDLKTGAPLEMPTGFDDFTIKAHQDYDNLPEKVNKNRNLLKKVMVSYGFIPLRTEWWHFSYPSKGKNFDLMDLSFEALRRGNLK